MRTAWKAMTFEDGSTVQMPVIATSANSWYYKPPQAKPSRPKETFGRGQEGQEKAERWLLSWFRDLIRTKGMPVEVEACSDDPVSNSYWNSAAGVAVHRWKTKHGSVIMDLTHWQGKPSWSLSVPVLISKELALRAPIGAIRSGCYKSGGKLTGDFSEVVKRFVADPWGTVAVPKIDGLEPSEPEIVPPHKLAKSYGTQMTSEAALSFEEYADAITEASVEEWIAAFRLAARIIPNVTVSVVKGYSSRLGKPYIFSISVTVDGVEPHTFTLELDTKKAHVSCSYQEDDRIQAQKAVSELKAMLSDIDDDDVLKPTEPIRTVESETTMTRL